MPLLQRFSCGDTPAAIEVHLLLREESFRQQQTGLSTTTLFWHNDQLVGFVALFASSITTTLPAKPPGTQARAEALTQFPSVTVLYLGVEEEHQGKRTGEVIIEWARAEVIASAIGARFLTAFVRRDSGHAQRFWARHGFRTVDEVDDSFFMVYDLYAS